MSRVFYFNITYRCNSKCQFCFSYSTNNNGKEMSFQEIFDSLKMVSPTSNDLIVINGGEPTIHKDFYFILSKIHMLYNSEIVVYTNGTILDILQVSPKSNLSFIVPIHGTEKVHNHITQIEGHYQKTINTLNCLNNARFRYKIKFILNEEMISSHFCIKEFLIKSRLLPDEIILARLNKTNKSKSNNVPIPTQAEIKEYILSQIKNLKNKYCIKLLDLPFCYLDSNLQISPYTGSIPTFFFNDIDHCMMQKDYYKDVMIGSNCSTCRHNKMCSIMKQSYLTLALDNNALIIERE